jgi:hypothetical protein
MTLSGIFTPILPYMQSNNMVCIAQNTFNINWNPGVLANNLMWWRSDKYLTVVDGNVTNWVDIIRNESLKPEAAGHAPLISQTSDYGGNSILDIRGTTAANYKNLMTSTFTSIACPIMVYAAAHSISNPANGILLSGNSVTRTPQVGTTGTASYIYAGGAGAVSSATGVVNTSPAAWCAEYNGVTSKVYHNNFSTAVATGNPGSNPMTQLYVGAASWSPGAYAFNGYVAEIIIRAGVDSSTTRILIRNYFANRYNI